VLRAAKLTRRRLAARATSGRLPQIDLLRAAGAAALEVAALRRGTYYVWYVLIQGEHAKIACLDAIEQGQADRDRCARVTNEIVNHHVRLSPGAVLPYLAEHLFRHGLDGGDAFRFLVGQSRVPQNGACDEPIRIPHQDDT